MKNLKNIKIIPKEMLEEIVNPDNENSRKLQKLLVVDSNYIDLSVLDDFANLSANELLEQEYISFTPILDENITNSKRNTFLIINLDEIDFSNWEDNMSVTGAIFIGTNRDHAVINNKDLRLLEMVDLLLSLFQNKKLSAAGIISMNYASFVTYSEYTFGYKISFKVQDQSNVRKAEI